MTKEHRQAGGLRCAARERSTTLLFVAALASLLGVGCGNQRPAATSTNHVHASDKAESHVHAPSALGSPKEIELLVVPEWSAAGPPIQVQTLADNAGVKVMSIRLRGATLPPHESDAPVVIVAVLGAGTVMVGDRPVRVDSTHAVTLAPKVRHSVIPHSGADLVLLVTHARGGRSS